MQVVTNRDDTHASDLTPALCRGPRRLRWAGSGALSPYPPKVLLLSQDAAGAIREEPEAPTVLVIEDDEDFRDIVSLRLRAAGFEVVAVHDAGAAWHVARRHPIQAVVVDFRLPGIDGRTLARQLKNILPDVAFIGFTAWPNDLTLSTSPFNVVHSKPDVEPVIASLRRYTSPGT